MVVSYACNRIIYSFMLQVAASYVLIAPSVTINITKYPDATVRSVMQSNAADLGANGGALSVSQQAAQPDTIAYPSLAIGVVPVYNLPNMPVSFQLTISSQTLSAVSYTHLTLPTKRIV